MAAKLDITSSSQPIQNILPPSSMQATGAVAKLGQSALAQMPAHQPKQTLRNEDLFPLEHLERHLQSIANPFVVWLILDLLKSKAASLPTSHFCLPQETLRLFHFLNQGGPQNNYTPLCNHWTLLNDRKLQEYLTSQDLKTLLTLPSIMRLSPMESAQLIDLLVTVRLDATRELFSKFFESGSLCAVDIADELKHVGYLYDLDTLIGEIIDHRSHKKDGTVSYWPQSEEYNLSKLQQTYDELRALLLREEHASLLNRLIDEALQGKLTLDRIRQERGLKTTLLQPLEALSQQYLQALQLKRPPEMLLQQLIREANLIRTLGGGECTLICRSVELVAKSLDYTKTIEGKKIILFMGYTGSGKSASIRFFLGKKLEYYTNSVGENVVRPVEADVQDKTLPQIGQSLATSETLYAQGYELPDRTLFLVDCPGFGETRGLDYELCTHMSIDQAITRSGQIAALVITLPVHALLQDKANSAFNLFSEMKERFQGTFNPDNMSGSTQLFILITKQGQIPGEILRGIADGSRFRELYEEEARRLHATQATPVHDSSPTPLPRYTIWKAVYRLYEMGHIHLIDIRNQKQASSLLSQYCHPDALFDKKSYIPFMKSRYAQQHFGDHTLTTLEMWLKIHWRYSEEIPQQLSSCQKNLRKLTDRLAAEERAAIDLEKIRALKAEREQIRAQEQTLRGHSKNMATLIKMERQTLSTLNQFALFATDDTSNLRILETDPPLVATCKRFRAKFQDLSKLLFQINKFDGV